MTTIRADVDGKSICQIKIRFPAVNTTAQKKINSIRLLLSDWIGTNAKKIRLAIYLIFAG